MITTSRPHSDRSLDSPESPDSFAQLSPVDCCLVMFDAHGQTISNKWKFSAISANCIVFVALHYVALVGNFYLYLLHYTLHNAATLHWLDICICICIIICICIFLFLYLLHWWDIWRQLANLTLRVRATDAANKRGRSEVAKHTISDFFIAPQIAKTLRLS